FFQPFTVPRGRAELGENNSLAFAGPDNAKITPEADSEYRVQGYAASGQATGGLVFAGYGIVLPGVRDDYKGLDVAGKVVILVRGGPATLSDEQRSRATPFTVKMATAAAHRAAAGLFLSDAETAKGDDALVEFRFGAFGRPAALPALFVKRAVVDRLLPAGKKLKDLEEKLAAGEPVGFAVTGWSATLA